MNTDELSLLFANIGLEEKKAQETAENAKNAEKLLCTIKESTLDASKSCERSIGLLLYSLAMAIPKPLLNHRPMIAKKISSGDFKTEEQLQACYKYLKGLHGADIDFSAMDEACGVGISVDEECVKKIVGEQVSLHREDLLKQRYTFNMASIMKSFRSNPILKWADSKVVKKEFDHQIFALLGERESEDEIKKMKKLLKEKSGKKLKEESSASTLPSATSSPQKKFRIFEGQVAHLHKPGENPQISEEIRQKHLAATGGRVVTRFPPEPNGYLHIGHAKAINLNFRYAEAFEGICYLRLDDTNPEAEELKYYKSIEESVRWLGFKPYKVTTASDNFQRLYEYALILIKKGLAYVCHMSQAEITESRGGLTKTGPRFNSPWRDRPIEENLREFQRMKRGEYEEGTATLRLKQDMQSKNTFMWDMVAYRVLFAPHCRTGTEWCIYPMYDFTHCLCDSIENITHSMCTTEFINAREAYYWVCDAVGVYKPVQWEFGRLNITNTVLSKSKLLKLVKEGHISGWDDPRVYTLAGLRRRGFTPAAINSFVEELGVTTNISIVDVSKLEAHVRADLNKTTARRMAILDPISVKITNLPADHLEVLKIPNDPRDPAKGESELAFTSTIYIDSSDFSTDTEDSNYYRLTPKQSVGIYQVGVFTCSSFKEKDGKIISIEGTIDQSKSAPKPKTFITWVPHSPAHNSPLKAEIRLYSPLFNSRDPNSVPGGFLADINPNSLKVIKDAFVDPRLIDAKPEDKYQFQRVGYFCVDSSSQTDNLVFNLTVAIKEDASRSQ